MQGYVYAIIAPELERVKIGRSFTRIGAIKRLTTCRCGSPSELQMHSIRKYNDVIATEKLLHKRFAAARVRGEWFEATDTKVEKWLEKRIEEGFGFSESEGLMGRPPTETLKAIEFLLDYLESQEGTHSTAVVEDARSHGIKKRTLENAKSQIGVISFKANDKWWWVLPS
jgi:hypothetical protein